MMGKGMVDKVSTFFWIAVTISSIGAFIFGFALGFTSPTMVRISRELLPHWWCRRAGSKHDRGRPLGMQVAHYSSNGHSEDAISCILANGTGATAPTTHTHTHTNTSAPTPTHNHSDARFGSPTLVDWVGG